MINTNRRPIYMYIVGLGAACALAMKNLMAESRRQRVLRDELWALLRVGVPGLKLAGGQGPRLPNTLSVYFPEFYGSPILAAAPQIAASTGSACHAGDQRPPEVLLAMGISASVALGAVRLSLGRGTTGPEIVAVAAALQRAYEGLTKDGLAAKYRPRK